MVDFLSLPINFLPARVQRPEYKNVNSRKNRSIDNENESEKSPNAGIPTT